MHALSCLRPQTLPEALAAMAGDVGMAGTAAEGGRVWLAGGQSLLAAMKLGMATPQLLVDLQDLPGLRDIRLEPGLGQQPAALWIGAMATHASVSASGVVQGFAPGLCRLAGGIADQQVRNMGTIGGSLAHNDPAACWPAGVLAAGATVVTSQRTIAADDFFAGLYTTALAPSELILGVRFPALAGLHYLKFEQPASRFALVGVAVARQPEGVRVAVTGLGSGVVRWPVAEQRLQQRWHPEAAQLLAHLLASGDTLGLPALGDLHASADYRRHLTAVLTTRCVAALSGQVLPRPAPLGLRATAAPKALGASPPAPPSAASSAASSAAANVAGTSPAEAPPQDGFGGRQDLQASPAAVWQAILEPRHLQASIPGCESLTQSAPDAFEATVKVGLGPLSVRFNSQVRLRDQHPPASLTLVFVGQAGALGAGEGTARVRFEPTADGGTRLHWWVQVQLSGRLAQFGNRLVEASARKLSEEFFQRFSAVLRAPAGTQPAEARRPRFFLWRWLARLARWFGPQPR